MKNLKIKDGAKILYHLYENYFNRLEVKEIFVSLELTKKQEECFYQYDFLTKEEIWAYANGMLELCGADLLLEREKSILQKHFLEATVGPLVKVFAPNEKCTVNSFILYNEFLGEDFDKTMYWLCTKKYITVQEAQIIVNNVIKFLEN